MFDCCSAGQDNPRGVTMLDFARPGRVRAAHVMRRLGVAVALVLAMGLIDVDPAAARQRPPTDAMTQVHPGAADEVLVRRCTSRPPTDYWWLEGGYPNPNGCQRCYERGAAYEATGTYYAWCSREVNGAILWLSCRVCREADRAGVTPVKLRGARALPESIT
jgi:hypothetical protein